MSDSAAASISNQTGIRSYEEYKQTREAKSELGKDDFLSLLAAQLQYQDPLEPQSDTQFVSQLAQFSSLQYMQTMSESFTLFQNYSLTGQCVSAKITLDDGTKKEIFGIVDRVVMQDGTAYAQIGDYMVKTSAITQVINSNLVADNKALLENTNLIGKYVKAYAPDGEDEDGKIITKTVEGLITRIAVEDNFLVGFLDDGTRIGLGDIFDISDTPFEASGEAAGDGDNVDGDAGETGETDTTGETDATGDI